MLDDNKDVPEILTGDVLVIAPMNEDDHIWLCVGDILFALNSEARISNSWGLSELLKYAVVNCVYRPTKDVDYMSLTSLAEHDFSEDDGGYRELYKREPATDKICKNF